MKVSRRAKAYRGGGQTGNFAFMGQPVTILGENLQFINFYGVFWAHA
jgi:hypothetical protein